MSEKCRQYSSVDVFFHRLAMVNPLDLLSSSISQTPTSSDRPRQESERHRGSIRETLKVIAQILVPLMIGTFTVVIALQQHNTAKENRRKDLEIATQLREQQYQLDEQRRNQEFQIEESRRIQDIAIASNKQRDAVFDSYIRDISHLLLINNYKLSRSMLDSIVRPMTLTILRQIDSTRKILLLKFLYESKMIRRDEKSSLVDLSDGDFNEIRLEGISMRNLSLIGTSLINSSFISMDLTDGDFEGTDLTDSLFIRCDLFATNFYRSRLVRVRFDQSVLDLVDLSLTDLTNSTLNEYQLQRVLALNMAILPNGTESENTSLIYSTDSCIIYNWNIRPRNGLLISSSCDFISLTDELQLTSRVGLNFYRKLIEENKALFQFLFETNQTDEKKIRVEFIYSENELKDTDFSLRTSVLELGFIVQRRCGSRNQTFVQYEISAKYPRHALVVHLRIYLQRNDFYSNFQFFVQHFDYEEYRRGKFSFS